MQQEDSWNDYYAKTQHLPPRKTLTKALEFFNNQGFAGFAIDLGCGSGRDAIVLLQNQWEVLGIDKEEEALHFLRDSLSEAHQMKFRFQCADFETIDLPPADLLNASYTLPFCNESCFLELWHKIHSSLRPGGRFAGQFLGDRDSWAKNEGILCYKASEVRKFLESFDVEFFEEEETDENTIAGDPKHWHIFHVVARKN